LRCMVPRPGSRHEKRKKMILFDSDFETDENTDSCP
jgi:hypothetical protein